MLANCAPNESAKPKDTAGQIAIELAMDVLRGVHGAKVAKLDRAKVAAWCKDYVARNPKVMEEAQQIAARRAELAAGADESIDLDSLMADDAETPEPHKRPRIAAHGKELDRGITAPVFICASLGATSGSFPVTHPSNTACVTNVSGFAAHCFAALHLGFRYPRHPGAKVWL
jgi:hypothetical protein